MREQAEKTMLAAYVTGGVEPLDGDVVEEAGTVHRRARRRLRDDDELGTACIRAHVRGQRGEALHDVHAGRFASPRNAEARVGDDTQGVLSIDADEVVTAVAEEREVV